MTDLHNILNFARTYQTLPKQRDLTFLTNCIEEPNAPGSMRVANTCFINLRCSLLYSFSYLLFKWRLCWPRHFATLVQHVTRTANETYALHEILQVPPSYCRTAYCISLLPARQIWATRIKAVLLIFVVLFFFFLFCFCL